jgi:hypothetical protein
MCRSKHRLAIAPTTLLPLSEKALGTFLLGVDVGKTACKAIVVDVSGSIVALGERPSRA